MSSPVSILATIVLALGAVEATAYWWMHPAPAGLGQPVLVYQPSRSAGVSPASHRGSEIGDEKFSSPHHPLSPFPDPQSSSPPSFLSTLNSQPSTSSTTTPLPEIYNQAAPMLRCSTGQVFHAQLEYSVGLHLAFFEWDDTDTGSVLEAFRHMPEACMGSIGMTLVSHEKPICYQVGKESLWFDHTIFHDSGKRGGGATLGPQVHAYRAIWVAGMANSNARQGIGGDEFDHLRTIRLKSAMTRFRPSHARVIQAAVRGAANPDLAWSAFESAMLKDLKFQ